MIYRPFILLIVTVLTLSILSCDKNQNKKAPAILTDNSLEKAREDSVLNSIKSKTKTFVLDATKTNTLFSKKGIKISVPENAFITANGEKPKGKVTVKIDEYHNPADILISGIPMQYNTANGPVQMESAGMFNITASAEGNQLLLAQGKEIAMQVPSKNTDTNFNLYYFDAATNEWKQTQEQLPVNNNKATKDVMAKTEPINNLTSEPIGMTIEWANTDAIKREVNGKTVTLVRPTCLYDDTYFTFPITTNTYPELSLFKESVWTGYTNQDNDKVRAAYDSEQLISAEIVEREIPLNKYLITFEFKHVKFKAYMKIASKNDFCEVNDEIYFSLYDQRPVDEKRIEQIQTKAKKAKKQEEVYRSFSINKLGIWNCDRLYLLTKKAIIHPRFRNKSNNELYETTTTYLIDKKINSVWTFSHAVTLNPDSDNVLVFVNEKGRLCYARITTLPETSSEKPMDILIDATELEDKPDNTDELNKLLTGV